MGIRRGKHDFHARRSARVGARLGRRNDALARHPARTGAVSAGASEGTGSLYGLGVENQNGWIGHNGNIAGFQTYAYYLPPEGKTVVVLVNSNADPLGVWNFFTEIVKIVSLDHPWPAPPS